MIGVKNIMEEMSTYPPFMSLHVLVITAACSGLIFHLSKYGLLGSVIPAGIGNSITLLGISGLGQVNDLNCL